MRHAEKHAKLAMNAAKRLAYSPQKRVLGHSVCYHLLKMIECEELSNRHNRRRTVNPTVNIRKDRNTEQFKLAFLVG